MTESIGRLPDESVQALRSTVNIISYLACVEELVQNAIDASATKIEVQLRKQQWACRVQDNGTGIRPQDFQKLGQRYCTSKAARFVTLHETATFGFRGEALASLAESSSLEVLSRHADSNPDDTHSLHIRVYLPNTA